MVALKEGRRKKEEGRGKKEEGRRKKEEGRSCFFDKKPGFLINTFAKNDKTPPIPSL